jgi:hypothetical protein
MDRNDTTFDFGDTKQLIQHVRELMASVPKPEFNSVVVSPETYQRLRDSAEEQNPAACKAFGISLGFYGLPIFEGADSGDRARMVYAGEVPEPALVEMFDGIFLVLRKIEMPPMAFIPTEPEHWNPRRIGVMTLSGD